ncbi:hypothetical protein EJ05DRAFT_447855 [Pseudovirgaria hyperparasitica]|uniref:WAC domain-containing protein n=1 Tax=Pseudovirgaria hyperparasitica TaxID=470096 RepID=A0A6A6WMM1_9PEZI|nr:uncharacterized protein EJ05DRAFT_447855 [Pseudovirgaria hyperparasitica]KAF2763454.1 hypothetical protein EJ05DRAFT_447855 [Pseudovirgaria hyperparasitica]
MVLHKKQIVPSQGLKDAEISRLSPNTELWALEILPGIEEYFIDYESYLRVKSYYDKKEFTCSITGRSGLTFKAAKASEEQGVLAVEMNFPDRLREPLLRRVQHDTTARFDTLVQKIYDEFKYDFYPGEDVFLQGGDSKLPAIVQEKVHINATKKAKYTLKVPAFGEPFTHVDNVTAISRSRDSFNKELLRSFLRATITRESWHGAPWTIRPEYCIQYSIDQSLPLHLQREAIGAKRKAEKMYTHNNGQDLHAFFHPDREVHHIRNVPNMRDPRMPPEPMVIIPRPGHQQHLGYQQQQPYMNGDRPAFMPAQQDQQFTNGMPTHFAHSFPHPQHHHHHHHHHHHVPPTLHSQHHNPQSQPSQSHPFIVNGKAPIPQLHITNGHRKSGDGAMFGTSLPIGQSRPTMHRPMPPIPVPVIEKIKYPIEDLDLHPRANLPERPPLKKISQDYPDISEDRVGDMLYIWTTLNMQKELFVVDNFSLDDMIEALSLTSLDVYCELLIELHCAVLKVLVNSKGNFEIESSWGFDLEDEEETSNSSRISTKSPSPAPEPPPPAKSTRSSLAKAGIVLKELEKRSPSPAPIVHRADELFAEYDWLEHLKERDFADGGWQMMLTGFIYKVWQNDSPQNRFEDQCEQILAHLVPADLEPSITTVVDQFASMEINLRIATLHIAVYFAAQTVAFRQTLDTYGPKIEYMRQEKVLLNREKLRLATELRELASQYAIERPNHLEESPQPEPANTADVSMAGTEENDAIEEDDEKPRKTLRNAKQRKDARKRKLEQEVAEKEAKKKKKAAKKKSDWEILCEKKEKTEEQLKLVEAQVEDKLKLMVQTDGVRVNTLGRDRWCNTYHWYENTRILPDGGPNSITGYSQGRLWVQGPPKEFYDSIANPPEQFAKEDKEKYGMSALERKQKDEGSTSLTSCEEWGYYDEPEVIHKLLSRLDDRGIREKQLISNLELERTNIARAMERMREFRAELDKTYQEAAEEGPRSRPSRKKAVVDPDAHKHCLEWQNKAAQEQLGHTHFQQPLSKKKRATKPSAKKTKAAAVVAKAPSPSPEPVPTRRGKRVTRQASKY